MALGHSESWAGRGHGHTLTQVRRWLQGWVPVAAGICVAKVFGAEMTGDPAMLANGCAEDIEVMPKRERSFISQIQILSQPQIGTLTFLKFFPRGSFSARLLTSHHTGGADWCGAGSHASWSGPPSLIFDDGI